MDGRSVSLSVDSASTSAEVCQMVAKKINLKDTYGFSLYIGMYDKVSSQDKCQISVIAFVLFVQL